ncbi:MAG: hypothetical protein HY023_17205 [Chloroflexi bacterium]|nr:hypothetical protein [Chloroflexota bacterium]
MSTTLTAEVLQDDIAVSLARVLAAANKRAREAGVDVLQSLITITQIADVGLRWRDDFSREIERRLMLHRISLSTATRSTQAAIDIESAVREYGRCI